MDERISSYIFKKEHLLLIIGTLILGLLANILFFASELGVSVLIFVTAFYTILFLCNSKEFNIRPNFPWALTIPVFLLSLTYTLYSNMVFYILNFMAITLLIVVQTLLITGNNTFPWHTPGFLTDILYAFFFRVFCVR